MGKGELTRQTILQHAVGLASALGLDGLTIGKLASDLRLSKSGLFAHFQSKETLQIQVLTAAAELFTTHVIRPAVSTPAGEARIRALFENWVRWSKSDRNPGGCVFLAAAVELDDKPGPVRDHLVALQKEWVRTMERIVRTGVGTGFLRHDADVSRIVQEIYGTFLSLNFYSRLLKDKSSEKRAREAFEGILDRFRNPNPNQP